MNIDIDMSFLTRDQLRNNFFIIKVGSENRPATQDHIDEATKMIFKAITSMDLDFDPAILVTHHLVSIEESRRVEELRKKFKENFTEFDRFELMEM